MSSVAPHSSLTRTLSERQEKMVEHRAQQHRFTLERDGEVAHLDYQHADNSVDFTHTWTPPALRGQGVAAQLVAAGIGWARTEGLEIHASCTYVAAWLEREASHQPATGRAPNSTT